MAAVGLTFQTGTPSTVGTVELDALLSEATDLSAKATEYAVEDDSPISDHIIVESERLKLSGWVTPSSVMQMTSDGRPKLLEAKASLRKIMRDRAELTISTGMDTYVGMVMETCNVGRSNEGDHLTVDCEFVKIRKVKLRTVDIPPDRVSDTATGGGKAARGKAGATETKAGKANPNTEPTVPQKTKLAEIWDR